MSQLTRPIGKLLAFLEEHAGTIVVLFAIPLTILFVKVAGQGDEIRRIVTSQTTNRALNVGVWCGAINEDRAYNKTFSTSTLKQSEAQVAVVRGALAGRSSLTPAQLTFLKLYLDSVVALEKSAPQVLNLHPYTLAALPCKRLERKTIASGK